MYDDNLNELFYDSSCLSASPGQFNQEFCLKSEYLSILNVNVRSLGKNFTSLLAFLSLVKTRFKFIVVTETWLSDSDEGLFSINGYNPVSVNRQNRRGGGIRIYYTENLNVSIVDNLTGLFDSHESLTIDADLPHFGKLTIFSIYRPPSSTSRPLIEFNNFLDAQFFNNTFTRDNNYIIIGDMNINYKRSQLYNNQHISEYFSKFQNNSFKFHVTNATRISPNSSESTLDHTWSNIAKSSQSYVFNYKITDHFPTGVIFKQSLPDPPKTIKYNDFSQRNIQYFLRDKDDIFSQLNFENQDANTALTTFNSLVRSILNRYFPRKSKQLSTKRKKMPWLSSTIIKCIKKKHNLFKMLRSHIITYRSYNTYSTMLNELLSIARVNYFQNAFNNNIKNPKETWKYINILNGKKRKSSPTHITEDNVIYTKDNDISNKLNQFFTSIPTKTTEALSKARHNYSHLVTNNVNSIVMNDATTEEIRLIILKLKTNNSTNDIPTRLLKLAPKDFAVCLSIIFNKMISSGEYPNLLKIARITPVHKNGKTSVMGNYRPISNLPTIDKIFEKLLYVRLESFFNKYNILSENQYGFMKNKDTKQAVLKVVNNILPGFIKKNYSICVFADFSKAFDTVNHKLLLQKLYKYGIRGNAHNLLKSFLSNRYQYVEINAHASEKLPIDIGVPQGSCLGPLLYNIYVKDVNNLLSDYDVTLYADDLAIHVSSDSLSILAGRMNLILSRLYDWCNFNNLTINPSKTKWMLFTNNKVPQSPEIYIHNKKIEQVKNFKYLGLHLDDKLKHYTHVKTITNKLSMYLGITRKLSNLLTLPAAKNYYYSFIHSSLSYGMIIWGGSLLASNYHTSLTSIQEKNIVTLFSQHINSIDPHILYKS